ncbi:hypothetical protein XELAEV_18040197mg [Xenopus laevis]|uniref:Uncharacterized protein n=1 Tax=Xenopus laevis TaxID=8355 RepID=A0A974C931_XENLA|nr:hypothetical protein XELAEV_18040197mg [Xenopus laevis]
MISDRVKNKRLGISEQLICGISVYNCFYYFVKVSRYVNILLIMHNIFIFSRRYKIAEFIFQLTTVSCKLWVSIWLSTYFCLKIVNCQPYALHLPTKTVTQIMSMKVYSYQNASFNTVFQSGNFSVQVYIINCSAAILLFTCSALTIIGSLCRHMNRIKHNSNGTRTSNVETHVQASKTLVILLFTNVIWFSVAIMQ